MTTKKPKTLTSEQLRDWLPITELAGLLMAPPEAIAQAVAPRPGRPSALAKIGFPEPAGALQGITVWSRRALLVHLADPDRKRAARKAIIEAATGVPLHVGVDTFKVRAPSTS